MWLLDNLSGMGQGMYNAITHLRSGTLTGGDSGTHNYVSVADDENTTTTTKKYRTVVMYGEPLRPTKFLFVPEMNDFYSDSELNTAYHSADEYRNAVNKYGFIYKTQKFDNADTVQKLFDYAKDWIKNNYHGGITSFNITALDMHLAGQTDLQKYTVGKRVNVKYKDPAVQSMVTQTLTVISAEYDLCKPENNQYKIGIPDVTLNKVYGETSKSGSGGGGGSKTKDEADDETNTEVDGLEDAQDAMNAILDEKTWAHMLTGLNTDGEGGFSLSSLLTPREKDPTSTNWFAMTADAFKSTIVEGVNSSFEKYFGKYIKIDDSIDTQKLSASYVASNAVKGDSGEFTKIKIGGKEIGFDIQNSKPRIMINGNVYKLSIE